MSGATGRGGELLLAALGGTACCGLTGILLASAYAPTPDHAHDSVRHIETVLRGGSHLRALHQATAWGTLGLWALLAARCFVGGRWSADGGARWRWGAAILAAVLLGLITGQVLPADARAWASARVASRSLESLPWVGEAIARIYRGGREVGAVGLQRAFTLHAVVLPVLLLLPALALWRRRRQDARPTGWVLALFLLSCLVLAHLVRASLGPPETEGVGGEVGPHLGFSPLARLMEAWPGPVWTLLVAGAAAAIALISLPTWRPSPRRDRWATGARAVAVLLAAGLWAGGLELSPVDAATPFRVEGPATAAPTPDSPPFLVPSGLGPDDRGGSNDRLSEQGVPKASDERLIPPSCRSCHAGSTSLGGRYPWDLAAAARSLLDPGPCPRSAGSVDELGEEARSRLLRALTSPVER